MRRLKQLSVLFVVACGVIVGGERAGGSGGTAGAEEVLRDQETLQPEAPVWKDPCTDRVSLHDLLSHWPACEVGDVFVRTICTARVKGSEVTREVSCLVKELWQVGSSRLKRTVGRGQRKEGGHAEETRAVGKAAQAGADGDRRDETERRQREIVESSPTYPQGFAVAFADQAALLVRYLLNRTVCREVPRLEAEVKRLAERVASLLGHLTEAQRDALAERAMAAAAAAVCRAHHDQLVVAHEQQLSAAQDAAAKAEEGQLEADLWSQRLRLEIGLCRSDEALARATYEGKILEADEELKGTQEQLDAATKDLGATRESLSAALEKANNAEAALAEEVKAGAGKLEAAMQELAAVKGEAVSLAAEVDTERAEVNRLREALEQANKAFAVLKASSEDSAAEADTRRRELESDLVAAKQHSSELEATLSTMKVDRERRAVELRNATTQAADAKAEASAAAAEAERLAREAAVAKEAELDARKVAEEAERAEDEGRRAERNMRETLRVVAKRMKAQSAELQAAKAEANNVGRELSKARAEVKESRAEVDTVRGEMAIREIRIEVLQKELDERAQASQAREIERTTPPKDAGAENATNLEVKPEAASSKGAQIGTGRDEESPPFEAEEAVVEGTTAVHDVDALHQRALGVDDLGESVGERSTPVAFGHPVQERSDQTRGSEDDAGSSRAARGLGEKGPAPEVAVDGGGGEGPAMPTAELRDDKPA